MPGEKQDLTAFHDKSVSNTRLLIDVTLPSVDLLLPDKDFLELIYNRSADAPVR